METQSFIKNWIPLTFNIKGSSWIRQVTKIKNFTPSGDVITKLKYNCKNSSTC